jgi:hypothetical protein
MAVSRLAAAGAYFQVYGTVKKRDQFRMAQEPEDVALDFGCDGQRGHWAVRCWLLALYMNWAAGWRFTCRYCAPGVINSLHGSAA